MRPSGARNKETNAGHPELFANAIPTRAQINHYLQNHNPNGLALYVISSGGNDVAAALTDNSEVCSATAQSDVQTAAASLANKIHTLQGHNAKYIIVANLVESFGTMDQRLCRQVYDTALMNKLNSLGVSYAWGDVNNVRMKIEGSSSTFGITIVGNDHPACSKPDASTHIGSSWALLCSPTSPASTPTNADTSEFADNEHWAPAAQKVLGAYYFCLAKNTWRAIFAASPAPNQPPFGCQLFNASWN